MMNHSKQINSYVKIIKLQYIYWSLIFTTIFTTIYDDFHADRDINEGESRVDYILLLIFLSLLILLLDPHMTLKRTL